MERFGHAARRSAHLNCVSSHDRALAADLLGVAPASVSVVANGVGTDLSDRRPLDLGARLGHWRRWLVEDPQGWDESGEPGTIGYTEADLTALAHGDRPVPVLLYVGRFFAFKRVAQLVRAYGAARAERGLRAPLVIWGGSPGEWEGEHPHTVARDEGIDGVFFVGWRGHEELPTGLARSDVLVAPSVDGSFGQVHLEAMACGPPVIATASGGPLSFVNTHTNQPNGWLVAPDNAPTLAAAIGHAAQNADEASRRGDRAYRQICAAYSWDALAEEFVAIYQHVMPTDLSRGVVR